jgi:hypothetical protein
VSPLERFLNAGTAFVDKRAQADEDWLRKWRRFLDIGVDSRIPGSHVDGPYQLSCYPVTSWPVCSVRDAN